MSDYIISTDSTCDLPKDYILEHNLRIQPLFYNIEGMIYGGNNDLPITEFYQQMRDGKLVSTMASNLDDVMTSFRAILSTGVNLLHIGFSSALSSSYSNAVVAANELRQEFPNQTIITVDSLCASLGQGLLVHKALELKEKGKSIEEVAAWLEANKLHLCHQFTVDDLKYLQRGGRISKTVATLGTLINVKPVLHVDNDGFLVSLNNVRGRKKALLSLVNNMEAQIDGLTNDTVFISHGDCLEDAQFVGNLVTERFGITNILYYYVSPTIGAHSGPGTVALFYIGNVR